MLTLEALLAEAREALLRADVVCPHTDADGLAAGAMALRARNEPAEAALLLRRGLNPFHAGALPEGYPAILDQGIRPFGGPALFVDHHAPEAEPREDQLYVGGSGEGRGVSTSVLMRRILPDQPAWLAAIGAVGDYSDDGFAPPECQPGPDEAKLVKSHVKKLVSLVNAPRRLPEMEPVREALALLIECDSPKSALADRRIAALEEAKAVYRAAFEQVVRTAPRVVDGKALIRFAHPFQLHPLVAQTWQRRLAPRAVIAANDGYITGRTHFAVRGGAEDLDLRAMLRGAAPPEFAGRDDIELGHGHTKATGGSMATSDFDRLIANLGF